MQILMSVMMATFMAMMVPRAAVCAERISEVLDTEPSVRAAGRAGRASPGDRAARRAARRRVHLPRRRRAGAAATSRSRRRPGHDDRDHRLAPAPARPRWSTCVPRLFDVDRRARCWSTASTCATLDPDDAVGADRARAADGRTCSPAPSPPTCATATRTRPTRSCGRRCEIAQARGLRRGDGRRARRADRPGRHQRLRRPAAAARASPGRWSRRPEIYLFDDSFSALDLATDARLRAALRPGHRATRP